MPSPLASAIGERLDQAEFLDGPAKAIGSAVRDAVPHGPVKDFLSGTWLGHALHPLLTDVPIGTWTSAVLLDLVGGRDAEGAAEKLLAIGLAATPITIATGWNEWADTEPAHDGVRRSGLVHAAANGTATALFAASLAARRSGNRGRGKLLGLAGMGLVGVGGWLGGHLSYAQGVGVDTTVFETGGEEWTVAMPAGELSEGRPACVAVEGTPVLLVRQGGAIHALADRCTHRGGALHEGELGEGTITCPLHGSCFRLEDGSVERGPAAYRQPLYDVRERDGSIEVRRRARADR